MAWDPEEVAEKISWEGGVAMYFTSYGGAEEDWPEEVQEAAKEFKDAFKNLEKTLKKHGADPDEFEM